MAVPMRPFSCAEARQEAARGLFEPLEPHTEATLAAHLAVCSDCHAHFEEMTGAAHLLETWLLRDDPPVELERRVLDAVRDEPGARATSRRRLATAVVVCGIVGLGLALLAIPPRTASSRTSRLVAADRAARANGIASVEETNGTFHLRLRAAGLPSLPDPTTYAVWISAGGRWRIEG